MDFGSGYGTVAYYIGKKLPRCKLVCADISSKWQEACRNTLRNYNNVAYFQGAIDNIINLLKDNGFVEKYQKVVKVPLMGKALDGIYEWR